MINTRNIQSTSSTTGGTISGLRIQIDLFTQSVNGGRHLVEMKDRSTNAHLSSSSRYHRSTLPRYKQICQLIQSLTSYTPTRRRISPQFLNGARVSSSYGAHHPLIGYAPRDSSMSSRHSSIRTRALNQPPLRIVLSRRKLPKL